MVSRPTAEELERLHCRQNRTTHAIAAIYGVQPWDVCEWLREHGITRRSDDSNIKDWEKIRLARKDVTEYALHLTSSLQTLKEILECGYLKPARGPRRSQIVGTMPDTIKGPHPAVCFTEQTLGNLCDTFANFGGRFFWPWGLAFRKTSLYHYGARPVIYGDDSAFQALPADWQYLWAKYDPQPNFSFRGYPRDFLHEREWRCRPIRFHVGGLSWNIDGVPILLPRDLMESPEQPTFLLLVFRQADADDLKRWLATKECASDDHWVRLYFPLLSRAAIVVFEDVRKQVTAGNVLWMRFDTLPLD